MSLGKYLDKKDKMGINLQVTGFCSLEGSKKLSDTQKAALVGRTVNLIVNGVPVVGTLFVSKSGGLTARFAVKCKTEKIGVRTEPKAERASALEALLSAIESENKSESELDEELGLNA